MMKAMKRNEPGRFTISTRNGNWQAAPQIGCEAFPRSRPRRASLPAGSGANKRKEAGRRNGTMRDKWHSTHMDLNSFGLRQSRLTYRVLVPVRGAAAGNHTNAVAEHGNSTSGAWSSGESSSTRYPSTTMSCRRRSSENRCPHDTCAEVSGWIDSRGQ